MGVSDVSLYIYAIMVVMFSLHGGVALLGIKVEKLLTSIASF